MNEISIVLPVQVFNSSRGIWNVLYMKTISSGNEVLEIKLEVIDQILYLTMNTLRKHFEVSSTVKYGRQVRVGIVCIVDVGVKLFKNGVLVGTDYVSDGLGIITNSSNVFILGRNPSTIGTAADGGTLAFWGFRVWLRQVPDDVFV